MESNWNQLIDRYFAGELSDEGVEAFEQLRLTNAAFAESVELQEMALGGIKRMGQRAEIAQLAKAYHNQQFLKKWLWWGGSFVLLVVVIGVLIWTNGSVKHRNNELALDQTAEISSDSPVVDQGQLHVDMLGADTGVQMEKVESFISLDQAKMNNEFAANTQNERVPAELKTVFTQQAKTTVDSTELPTNNTDQPLEVTRVAINDNFVNSVEFPVPDKMKTFYFGGKVGLIDTIGRVVLKPFYDSIGLVHSSYTSKVTMERYVRIINHVKEYSYSAIYFYKGFSKGKWFLMNSAGNLLNPLGFDEISNTQLSDGLLIVKNDGLCGIMDYTGNLVLDCQFDKIISEKGTIYGYKGAKKIKIKAIKSN